MLRGMILTRAVDTGSRRSSPGRKCATGTRRSRARDFDRSGRRRSTRARSACAADPSGAAADGAWHGDVIAPIIRDLGAALAMRPDGETVRMVLNAQMGKAGPPMDGRDLHIGDFAGAFCPPSAPLSISSLTVAGMGLAFRLAGSDRVAVSFIGEGGSSLGEWHEAINLCAARRLPVIFCLQNNQTALSTPVADQSAVRVFADKADRLRHSRHHDRRHRSGRDRGGVHLGRRARARRPRAGAHRARRDAHVRARASRRHAVSRQGSAAVVGRIRRSRRRATRIPSSTRSGARAIRSPTYAQQLEQLGVIQPGDLDRLKQDAEAMVEAEARR